MPPYVGSFGNRFGPKDATSFTKCAPSFDLGYLGIWGIFWDLYEIRVIGISPGFPSCPILINLPHLDYLPHLLVHWGNYFPHLPHMWELHCSGTQREYLWVSVIGPRISIICPICWILPHLFDRNPISHICPICGNYLGLMWEINFELGHMWELGITHICPHLFRVAPYYFPQLLPLLCLRIWG